MYHSFSPFIIDKQKLKDENFFVLLFVFISDTKKQKNICLSYFKFKSRIKKEKRVA